MTVLGCGPTGELWSGEGFCIGVNDCEKFGKPVSALVCVNSKFELPREQIIKRTVAPEGFYSQLLYWVNQPNFKHLSRLVNYTKQKTTDTIYTSRTSPFVAISLAAYLGHKEIVLYGVDFDAHPNVHGHLLKDEVRLYRKYADALLLSGIVVYLGTDYGALSGFLPVKK